MNVTDCVFCKIGEDKILLKNDLAFVISDRYRIRLCLKTSCLPQRLPPAAGRRTLKENNCKINL